MKYLDTRNKSLEDSVIRVLKGLSETNKNDKSDDGEGLDAVQKDAVKKKFKDRKDKDIDNDGDVDDSDKFIHKKRKAITKAISKDDEKNESFDIGNDWAKHTLKVTPGQNENDVDEMLGIMEKKRTSMREALAKMWGVNEGKNPFKNVEEKPLTKTMTGQKPTKVELDPKTE